MNEWIELHNNSLCDWIVIDNFTNIEFETYLNSLSELVRSQVCQLETKKQSIHILKNIIKSHSSFYNFIYDFSPVDFKHINGLPHVSQRVLGTHVNLWNSIHPDSSILNLRTFHL